MENICLTTTTNMDEIYKLLLMIKKMFLADSTSDMLPCVQKSLCGLHRATAL